MTIRLTPGEELRAELRKEREFQEEWGRTQAYMNVLRWAQPALLMGYFALVGSGLPWVAWPVLGASGGCLFLRWRLEKKFERLLDERIASFPTGLLQAIVADETADSRSRKTASEELAKRAAAAWTKASHDLN